MIQNIYGRGGFAIASFLNGVINNSAIFYGVLSEITFTQYNSIIESNNGTLNSKTSGWRIHINVELLNVDDGDYGNLVKLKNILNDSINDNMELRVYPKTSALFKNYQFNYSLSPYYICKLDTNIDVDDLSNRIDRIQSLLISFVGVLLMLLPHYMFDGFPMIGIGTVSEPFGIYNLAGLIYLSENEWLWTKKYHFEILNDIDMSSVTNWNQIGGKDVGSTSFNGYIDGNGYTISNLTHISGNDIYTGFIGKSSPTSTITNLNIDNFRIENNYNITSRAINVGLFGSCTVNNISVNNSHIVAGHSRFAGIVKPVSGIDISNITVTNSDIIACGYVGAVCGSMEQIRTIKNIVIKNCNVANNNNYCPIGNYTGGVIGNGRASFDVSTIDNIFVDEYSQVSGKSLVGGVFGCFREQLYERKFTISNIKSSAEVIYNTTNINAFAGGIFGYILNEYYQTSFSNYNNILFNGHITLGNSGSYTAYIGGICGKILNPPDSALSTITGVYYNSDKVTTPITTINIGIGKTDIQLKDASIYSNYSIEYWQITNGYYPILIIGE